MWPSRQFLQQHCSNVLSAALHFIFILGDPGADSGAEDENQNGWGKIRRAKVRKKNTSPWGQTIYAPVPNGWTNTRSWNFFPPILIFVFGPTICPWVSEDASFCDKNRNLALIIGFYCKGSVKQRIKHQLRQRFLKELKTTWWKSSQSELRQQKTI